MYYCGTKCTLLRHQIVSFNSSSAIQKAAWFPLEMILLFKKKSISSIPLVSTEATSFTFRFYVLPCTHHFSSGATKLSFN